MSAEKRWESIAIRKQKEVDLFERKFLDYRNKMLEVLDRLKEKNELPDLQKELIRFLQEEQGDVEFYSNDHK